ncbi:unnamed protein product [Didymodactylos carnosus]|uniref:Uncharacterized protein n=1 Tax=Didymodactylos carnosus TaxID=1234261 RepID=A0A813T4I4_9BILA|nr:unnamed protein product [Didymodactylos carnosus]CAF3590632.1 unnamed protein product [Didymodactylos carnosus]
MNFDQHRSHHHHHYDSIQITNHNGEQDEYVNGDEQEDKQQQENSSSQQESRIQPLKHEDELKTNENDVIPTTDETIATITPLAISNCEESIKDETVADEVKTVIDETTATTTTTTDTLPSTTTLPSITETTSSELPPTTSNPSVARILVKPGQIFRVQVDNEVKEVHEEGNCTTERTSTYDRRMH